jgi:hypothetical protein
MTSISPIIDVTITCHDCNEEFQPTSFHLTGTHVLGSGKCKRCQEELFIEMPTGSGLHYPVVVDSKGERKDGSLYSNWFTAALQNASRNKVDMPVHIEKIINSSKRKEKLLVLNTIDQSYGHCIFTLFNTDYYASKLDFHLLVIVQKELRWLVPDGIDEVWIVDMPFSRAQLWHTSLVNQINERIAQFPKSFLCRAFPQAPEGEFDVEKFSRIKPFPLDEWNKRLENPVVTFVWRTDRFWKRVLPRLIENRITIRFFPNLIRQIRNNIQFRWIIRFSEELRRKAPTIDFAVAGMDTREFKLPKWVKDYRYPYHDDKIAREMCERYAASHLIIGCNGSSLVLPSFHAGAVVNIVPHDGWAVSAGSYYLRPTSPADVQYRYLLLPAETSIARVVKVVVQILRDRPLVQILSGKLNNHDEELHSSAWSQFRTEGFRNIKYFREKEGLLTS